MNLDEIMTAANQAPKGEVVTFGTNVSIRNIRVLVNYLDGIINSVTFVMTYGSERYVFVANIEKIEAVAPGREQVHLNVDDLVQLLNINLNDNVWVKILS